MKLAHRCLVAGLAVLLAVPTGTPATARPPVQALQNPAPVPASVRTVAITGAHGFARSAAVEAGATAPFSMVGASWDDPSRALAGTVQVSTRSAADGSWSPWRTLESDIEDGAAAEPGTARGATDPLWVGASNGVQVRATGTGLPAGLRLDLVDPGTADPAAARAQVLPEAGSTVPRPVPAMVSRSQWGANESIVRGQPSYTGAVQALFVHHTAGSNAYSCADSPALLRGIQAYHVRTKGWNDIGYNFLVDKCGTLYEGRGGGVTKPVLGAHTFGFNTNTAGIAVLGDYGSTTIGSATRTAIAQIAAWKLGMSGLTPTGRVTLTAASTGKFPAGTQVTMNRISGHRDAVGTECPGNALYGQLGGLRTLAAGPATGLRVTGFGGAVRAGSRWYTRGSTTLRWDVDTSTRLLRGFEIVLDGSPLKVVSAGSRSYPLRLGQGVHTVAVRVIHLAGRTGVTAPVTVIADRVAPDIVAGPELALRPGTVGPSAVGVTVGWRATDARGLSTVTVDGPRDVRLPGSVNRWATSAPPGPATWTVRAVDPAGNVGRADAVRTVALAREAAATAAGSWRTARAGAHLGGAALVSSSAGANLTYTFTGRAVGLIAARTARSGQLRIRVDGALIGTIDLRAGTTAFRQLVWHRSFSTPGTHTVRVEVVGTAGRPGTIVDGFVTVQ